MHKAAATAANMAAAAFIAIIVSVVALTAIARVDWPAYPSSNQLHALTTVGQVGCLIGLLTIGLLWRSKPRWRWPLLDQLRSRAKDGTLVDYVRQNVTVCQ